MREFLRWLWCRLLRRPYYRREKLNLRCFVDGKETSLRVTRVEFSYPSSQMKVGLDQLLDAKAPLTVIRSGKFTERMEEGTFIQPLKGDRGTKA